LWSGRLAVITGLAVTFGVASGLGGLYVSTRWNVAAGAAIALLATGVLLVSWVLTRRLGPAR
jgi:ABC-type Mn2+/Zn2+ transport system permease subunit